MRFANTIRLAFDLVANSSIARSMEVASRTDNSRGLTAADEAASCMTCHIPLWSVSFGSSRTPTSFVVGIISFNTSKNFPPSENSPGVKPVKLPPGLANEATAPAPTGSFIWVKTMGIAWFKCSRANTGVGPLANKTFGFNLTSSAANVRIRSGSSAGNRTSITTLRPSTQPRSRKPARRAST